WNRGVVQLSPLIVYSHPRGITWDVLRDRDYMLSTQAACSTGAVEWLFAGMNCHYYRQSALVAESLQRLIQLLFAANYGHTILKIEGVGSLQVVQLLLELLLFLRSHARSIDRLARLLHHLAITQIQWLTVAY